MLPLAKKGEGQVYGPNLPFVPSTQSRWHPEQGSKALWCTFSALSPACLSWHCGPPAHTGLPGWLRTGSVPAAHTSTAESIARYDTPMCRERTTSSILKSHISEAFSIDVPSIHHSFSDTHQQYDHKYANKSTSYGLCSVCSHML